MSARESTATVRRTVPRRTRFALALPVAFASGCLLIAPPEDLPALGSGGHGGHGGSSATAGAEVGGTGATTSGTGGNGGESAGEGGRETSGGSGAKGGKGGTGAGGKGGSGAIGGSTAGGRGGTGAGGGKGGAGGSAGEGGEPECTTNADCVSKNGSDAARCRPSDGACKRLQTPDCPIAYAGEEGTARFSDPNAIFMGAMVALDPQFPARGSNLYALELAIDEINSAGGLPDGPGGATRPIVLIVCQGDTSSDPNVVKRGIEHLAADIQLQGLVVELQPEDLFTAFNDEKGRQLLFMNAGAISASLAPNTKQLMWTLLGRPQDYAAAYALLLSDVEKYVRQQRGLQPADPIKVAMVHTNDGFDDDLYQSTDPTLKFNGTSAENQLFDADTKPDGKYLNLLIDVTQSDLTSQIQSTAEQIVTFAPDIVVSAAGQPMFSSDGTMYDGVLERIEDAMPAPRPYYILSPYNAATAGLSAVQSVISAEIASDPNVAGRFMGISGAAAPPDEAQLETDFAASFNKRYGLSAETPGQVDNLYDAVYYLAYAMYASNPPMTGPGISAGMQHLITGTPLNDGPDDITQVFQTLKGGGSVALYSTLGAPDFDPTTGVRPATPGIFCFTWNDGIQQSQHWLDVLRYDGSMFTGNYNCLNGFPPP